jgi:hypothetical protein
LLLVPGCEKEIAMGFDQRGTVVIHVSPAEGGRWDVWEEDFENPLASFDEKEEACEYADKLTMAKEGATVVVVDENRPDRPQDDIDIAPRA